MSNIDKQALRNLAVAAKLAPSWYAVGEFGDVVDPAKPEWKPVHEFCKTFTAARVLALLDELEAKDRQMAELLNIISRHTIELGWGEKPITLAELIISREGSGSDALVAIRAAAAGKGESS
ncbi:ead/Ea22-like family protein [Enterobacter hormaechei]|uniref:ead/Ea22-like family protein n=1 Tax=Enterobacter hormaechei TaxID=158836 RepID=UPI001F4449AC|nr:ead/Ea22-like family protein [Enterobacter hormaechei]